MYNYRAHCIKLGVHNIQHSSSSEHAPFNKDVGIQGKFMQHFNVGILMGIYYQEYYVVDLKSLEYGMNSSKLNNISLRCSTCNCHRTACHFISVHKQYVSSTCLSPGTTLTYFETITCLGYLNKLPHSLCFTTRAARMRSKSP